MPYLCSGSGLDLPFLLHITTKDTQSVVSMVTRTSDSTAPIRRATPFSEGDRGGPGVMVWREPGTTILVGVRSFRAVHYVSAIVALSDS